MNFSVNGNSGPPIIVHLPFGPRLEKRCRPCFRAKDLSTPNFDFDNFGLDIAILYVKYAALWTDCRHCAFPFF